MYIQRWIKKELIRSFFPWVNRMDIEYELSEPMAPFQYEDFEVRMHQSDWQKFYEHF